MTADEKAILDGILKDRDTFQELIDQMKKRPRVEILKSVRINLQGKLDQINENLPKRYWKMLANRMSVTDSEK